MKRHQKSHMGFILNKNKIGTKFLSIARNIYALKANKMLAP